MSSTDARGTRASSAGHTSRAAGRYLNADAASISDIEDDIDDRADSGTENVDGEGAGPSSGPAAAETSKKPAAPSSRPASHGTSPGTSHRQFSFSGRRVSTGRSNNIASRRDSSEGNTLSPHQQPSEAITATYGLPPFLQNSTGASSSSRRLHPNGLPMRQPAGPLPGAPYISDLASRYPVRQAPASGPQVALVSGQLYVSDRLREVVTTKKSSSSPHIGSSSGAAAAGGGVPHAAAAGGSGSTGTFPTPDMLIPTYADQPYPTSSYLQQRRAEKEQRAFYTGQQQPHQHLHPSVGRASWVLPDANAGPGPSSTALGGQLTAGRVASATTGLGGRNGGGGGAGEGVSGAGGGSGGAGVGMSSKQRDAWEGVERWLETSDSCGGELESGPGGRPQTRQPDTSNDPSLVYRQYGIFRSYAKHSQGLWPSISLPSALTTTTTQRTGGGGGGLRVAFERDRTSSGTSGASPKRPSSQSAASPANARTSSRQNAW